MKPPLHTISERALRWELWARDDGARTRGDVPGLEAHTTGDIRRELARRHRERPRDAQGRLIQPIPRPPAADHFLLERLQRAEVARSLRGDEREDEPSRGRCCWCGDGYPRRNDDNPLCYVCQLRESADRARREGRRGYSAEAYAARLYAMRLVRRAEARENPMVAAEFAADELEHEDDPQDVARAVAVAEHLRGRVLARYR